MNKVKPLTSALLALPFLAAFSVSAHANQAWPDLPDGVKNGVGAQIESKIYVGLGSMGKQFYMLDLEQLDKGWQKQADFSGPARDGATASVIGDDIYIFGGSGKVDSNAKSPIVFDSVYRFDADANSWSEVATKAPVGLLGAASYSPDDEQILFFGGYNKGKFDQYLHDVLTTDSKEEPEKWQKIVSDFMGMKPTDYQWNRQVLSYTPSTNEWQDLGASPYLPNCGAALVVDDENALLISGEIKPGLRTAEVKSYHFGEAQPWLSEHPLPTPSSQPQQEGVAGAFAGFSNGVVLVAGGANFHGAKLTFDKGNMFAHNGLPKAFNAETYVFADGAWKQDVNLKEPLAYGVSFSIDDGILMVGGENPDSSASPKVTKLAWNGKHVEQQD
ncbi:N-acetylneuraminate epimerase [Enterovibrio sp. ZSDZ35]|uniref:N-acetylneuraminate epimerase n=1 Tax=Enterovibrio qingdaonensis TaxID=2899818 RepID=A0ABT5QNN7_9GAMM|nr:N-acetylneuraminate epimerase [Enterovibrio sp. ZSDZ35]MDD1782601.1 N-acetylneuraminate epimerase [Enterovibrio sp. ZSDZ35]